MTAMPEKLEKLRDEYEPRLEIVADAPWNKPFRDSFNNGFDACWNHLEPVITEMREALEFYGQETVPDTNSLFAKSAMEFGENVVTWEPLTDMGNKARQTLAKAKEVLG